MNKIEYWFLDAAIRLKIPFHWLSAGNVDEILNRPHHHLAMPELITVLERMFERGDLFLEYTNRREESSRVQKPSRSEIEAALLITDEEWMRRPEQIFYGVTARGGALWETLSNPQWDRFFEEGYGTNPDEGEMSALTRDLIEERLSLIPYDGSVKAIVPESIRWSVLQPWQATYWKQLPVGYHVEFTYVPLTEEGEKVRQIPPEKVDAWYERVRRWYTNPNEDDGTND